MKRPAPGESDAWARFEARLHELADLRAGFEEALDAFGIARGSELRERLEALPIEGDEEQLALWLLGLAERGAPESLRFRLVASEWHGRSDAFDLGLEGAPPAGSAVLARLASLARETAAPLPLAYAALAVRAIVERVDPRLLLGPRPSAPVSVEDGERRIELGELTREGLERGGRGSTGG